MKSRVFILPQCHINVTLKICMFITFKPLHNGYQVHFIWPSVVHDVLAISIGNQIFTLATLTTLWVELMIQIHSISLFAEKERILARWSLMMMIIGKRNDNQHTIKVIRSFFPLLESINVESTCTEGVTAAPVAFHSFSCYKLIYFVQLCCCRAGSKGQDNVDFLCPHFENQPSLNWLTTWR